MSLPQILIFAVTIFLRVVLVPGVLIVLLVISWHVAYRSTSPNRNIAVSKVLAFWFGLVLFIVLVVSTIFIGQVRSIAFDGSVAAFLALLALGLVVGIAIMVSIDV